MYRSTVRPDGTLHLGEAALCIGFAPGAVVEIVITITEGLMLRVVDDHPIDLAPAKPLPSPKAGRPFTISGRKYGRRALAEGSR